MKLIFIALLVVLIGKGLLLFIEASFKKSMDGLGW